MSSSALVVYNAGGKDDEDETTTTGNRRGAYAGLSNQGATCYLNGMLQTLFMTPEFRRAIFKWRFDADKHGPAVDSIPYQLQYLFGHLQLGTRRAVESTGLTKSFGWDGGEVFQQKDVQELALVLFDRLEEDFKATEFENVIKGLYGGQLVDYLRCIDLDYESEREAPFLDISLPIVPFGQTAAYNSLIDCIEAYLTPEILDGDNKYKVESLGGQASAAIKGLKFAHLPQILQLPLKRFAIDMTSHNFSTRKINDIVKFPMVLDMNKYVTHMRTKPQASSEEGGAGAATGATGDSGPQPPLRERSVSSGSNAGDSLRGRSSSVGSNYDPSQDEFEAFLQEKIATLRAGVASGRAETAASGSGSGAGAGAGDWSAPDPETELVDCNGSTIPSTQTSTNRDREQLEYTIADIPRLLEERGEWIYELFSVLVHQGGVTGGHYYAYIKDVDSQKWWNFNDSSVTECSWEKVCFVLLPSQPQQFNMPPFSLSHQSPPPSLPLSHNTIT